MTPISFRAPGTQATLRGVGIKVFWAYPTVVVEDTPSLIALYLPAGAAGKNTAHRPVPEDFQRPGRIAIVDHTWQATDVLMLIVPGEAFSTYLMWETGAHELDCWYINLQEPIRRTRIGYETMDHMLDVVVSPDLSKWRWKDEDEFAEAERIGFYSPEKCGEIRTTGERALRLLTSEQRAFYETWRDWQPSPEWSLPRLSVLWDRLDLEEVL